MAEDQEPELFAVGRTRRVVRAERDNDPEMSGWALCTAPSELLIQQYGAAQ
jgi:hypothetical protein